MIYSGYELLWLFFASSFLGWGLEALSAAVRQKRFVNRGLVNGPLCVIYGVTAVLNAMTLQELPVIWVFVGAAIMATVVEWTAGHLLESLSYEKWWDYSGIKWNLDGYICVSISILWGFLGTVMVLCGNDLILYLYHWLPQTLVQVFLWIGIMVVTVDVLASLIVISGRSRRVQQWKDVDRWLTSLTMRIEDRIYSWVEKRLSKAYPIKEKAAAEQKEKTDRFAAGCSVYKIVLLFFIGAFLGDITETIFCRIRAGVWMSRSSVVWGPFSIVWGFAIAAATALLYRYRNNSDRFLFLMGTVLGGGYEYFCSVLSEIMFGTVFWDYSEIPFNLGGRINLLYCFFWGIAAVVWFKVLYPYFSAWIEMIPKKFGKIMTWCLIVFMCCNMAVSALALWRSNERLNGIPAESTWQEIMDERYDDEKLSRIYPNAIRVDTVQANADLTAEQTEIP